MTEHRVEPTYRVEIFIGGDYEDAKRICRDYCTAVGLCVTVERTFFAYSFGGEDGIRIGLLNYPRFPAEPQSIRDHAAALGGLLMTGLSQGSYLIVTPEDSAWTSRRP